MGRYVWSSFRDFSLGNIFQPERDQNKALLIFYFQTTYAISCKTILIISSYLELALILDIKIHMKRSRPAIDS